MERTKEQILHEHYQEVGRKGGQSTSEKKMKAIMANLQKAMAKRWGKKVRLRKKKDKQ